MNTAKNHQRGANDLIAPGKRIPEATIASKEAEVVDETTGQDRDHDLGHGHGHGHGLDPGRDRTLLPAPDQDLDPDPGLLRIVAAEAVALTTIEARRDQIGAEVAVEAVAEAVQQDSTVAAVVVVSHLHHIRFEGLMARDRIHLSHLFIVPRSHKAHVCLFFFNVRVCEVKVCLNFTPCLLRNTFTTRKD